MTSKKVNLVDWYIQLQNEYIEKYGEKTLVMMEVGSFYECYAVSESQYKHLQDACKIMSIRITRKNNKIASDEIHAGNPYMAGVTSIAFDKYMVMLLPFGYNIVRVDQVTEPPNPKREVVRVYSKGTYDNPNSESNTDNNLLVLYLEEYENKSISIGISIIDITIGTSYCCEFHDNPKKNISALVEAYRVIYGSQSNENVLYHKNIENIENIVSKLNLDDNNTTIIGDIDDKWYNINYQDTFIRKHFHCPGSIQPQDQFGLEMYHHCTLSMLLGVKFLEDHEIDISKLLCKPKIIGDTYSMTISQGTIDVLDIVSKISKSNSSLLHILDDCKTPMGKRLLKSRLLQPIINKKELLRRYDMTDSIGEYNEVISSNIKYCYDIDRLHRKLCLGKLKLFEFANLDDTYKSINNIVSNIINSTDNSNKSNKLSDLLFNDDKKNQLLLFNLFIETYRNTFNIEKFNSYSCVSDITENIFVEGKYQVLDQQSIFIKNTLDEINDLRLELCMLSNDSELKGKYQDLDTNIKNKIGNFVKLEKTDRDGYSFKMTKSRNKMLKNNIKGYKWKTSVIEKYHNAIDTLRYNEKKSDTTVICTWLENKSKDIVYGLDKLRNLTSSIFKKQQEEWYLTYSDTLTFVSEMIAEIDFCLSNYNISNKYHYCRPEIVENEISGLKADNLRHAITERVRNDILFVPNPVELGSLSDNGTFGSIITGLNGVGKSIYIKSIAISIIMAQSGFYVPAENFKLSLYNKVFTRIGNIDNLFRGQSTFYREMLELDNIIRNSDKNSLVIADELCSGSEQTSAQAILTTTIIELCTRNTSNLITTHFHDCLDLQEIKDLQSAEFYHFKISYKNNDIIYDRNLLKGKGPKLYGVEVATNIISNKQFIDTCFNFRKKILKLEEGNNHSSKYNAKIQVEKCEICQKVEDYPGELHVHHINEQEYADKYDNIEHVKKNSKGNLVVLCQKHHEMTHHGGLTIGGWKQSIEKGTYLDYNFNINIDKDVVKYNNETIISHTNDIINSNIRENSSNISMDNNESIDKKCSVKDPVSDIKDDDIVNDDTLSNRKKYNSETIALVRSLYEKHKKVKKVKQVLETEYNFKPISQQTINKMWNNKY